MTYISMHEKWKIVVTCAIAWIEWKHNAHNLSADTKKGNSELLSSLKFIQCIEMLSRAFNLANQ